VRAKFPQLEHWAALKVAAGVATRVLKRQLVLAAATAQGRPVDATSVQTGGVLDDVYAYEGPLGATVTRCAVEPHCTQRAPAPFPTSRHTADESDA
jgi:hypothetical protein